MFKLIRILLMSVSIVYLPSVFAAVSPLSVAIVPGVQFPPSDYSVTGLRVSALWGHHRDVYGIDVGGLGNVTELNFTGLAISGIFNLTEGTTNVIGLQFAGLTNINKNKTHVTGVQATLGVNSNEAESTVVGLAIAPLANIEPFTKVYGAQIGIYNRAQDVYGFQIGIVNVAKSLHGLQIGLANFNETGLFFVSPILNFGF